MRKGIPQIGKGLSRAGKQRIASSLAKLGLEGLRRKLEGNIGGPWV